ncbi:hypothetical protein AYO38_04650 [bacterium SCGC AG-212-C10]|nr:hypothetical protein AYO38_04650 [bacterium SCGC AG-212-C10]
MWLLNRATILVPLVIFAVFVLPSAGPSAPAGAAAAEESITFDFENEGATSTTGGAQNHPGALTSLVMTKSGLTMTITRQGGGTFDIVQGNQFWPPEWGSKSLDPFSQQTSNTRFIATFSEYVSSVYIEGADIGGDNDHLGITAYELPDGQGQTRGSDGGVGVPSLPDRRGFLVSNSGIRSVTFIGGAIPNIHSVYWDRLIVTRFIPDPPAEGRIDSVEFTQAIQQLQTLDALKADLLADGRPPVPMVAGKPAAMRVYLEQTEEPLTQFQVELSGVQSQTITTIVNNTCTPEDRRRQENGCASVDFYFTPPLGSWTATLRLRDSVGDLLEEHQFGLQSVESDALVLRAIEVCDQGGCGNPAELYQHLPYLRQVMPTHDVQLDTLYRTMNVTLTPPADPDDVPEGWSDAVDQANALFWLPPVSIQLGEQWFYVAVFRPDVIGPNGLASRPGRGMAMRSNNLIGTFVNGARTFAHELAHNMGVHHTNVALPASQSEPGCYSLAAGSNSGWLHLDNLLRSETPGEQIEVGFDVAQGLALPGDENFELMGYCVPRWISPYTYNLLLEQLSGLPPSQAQSSLVPTAVSPHWLVRGQVQGGTATLNPLLTIEAEAPPPGAGTHFLRVLGAGNAILAERTFSPVEPHSDIGPGQVESQGPPSFTELLPVMSGATAVVVLDGALQELGRITLGGIAPAVTVAANVNTLSASWQVTDFDSLTHSAWVQYSSDGGVSWTTLAQDHETTSISLDASKLPGSANAVIRVLANDGVNTGVGTSQPFVVAEKLPTAQIVSPAGGSFRPHELVWLQGAGTDTDEALPGSALSWTSSRDGSLGTGATVAAYQLSPGLHTITLIVQDSDGNTANDSIQVRVGGGATFEGMTVSWGDNDCSGVVLFTDTLRGLVWLAGDEPAAADCPGIGTIIGGTFGSTIWGDVDCNGVVDAGDALKLLRHVTGLPVQQGQGCPALGTLVSITPN